MSHYSFPLAGKPEIKSTDDLRKLIIEKGTFSAKENEDVFQNVFKRGPRRRLYELIRKNGLDKKSVLDFGCGMGHTLIHLGPGSYGIDIKKGFVDFAKAIGLTAYQFDAVKDDLSELPKVDNVIVWAVMEHVDSQHLFLRNLYSALNPGGRVFLYVPTVPSFIPWFLPKRFRKYWIGHTHGDHVNAYSYRTLRFICERAGFKTISCNPGFYGLLSWLNLIPWSNNFVDGCVYIGEAIPDWEYPKGSRRTTKISNSA